MSETWRVRPAAVTDAERIADVHVTSWRETYRGLMADEVLDDPAAADRRLSYWSTTLTELATSPALSAWVAVERDTIVGFALSGEPRDSDASWPLELYALYVLSDFHGTGIGAALLRATTPDDVSAGLWVAEANSRAIAFYTKHGFVRDGARVTHHGVDAIRLVSGPGGTRSGARRDFTPGIA